MPTDGLGSKPNSNGPIGTFFAYGPYYITQLDVFFFLTGLHS